MGQLTGPAPDEGSGPVAVSATAPAGAAAPAGSLEEQGTTVRAAESLGNWGEELDRAWAVAGMFHVERWRRRRVVLRRVAAELEARASGVPEGGDAELLAAATARRRARYAHGRQLGLAQGRAARAARCGESSVRIRCGCGPVELPIGCGQIYVCPICRDRHHRRWKRRIVEALGARLAEERAAWARSGRRRGAPAVYMLTLTIGHSGDLARDRADLSRLWTLLRRRLWSLSGRAFPFALAVEYTAGRDGLGHVHAHVVAVLPWFDWAAAQRAWKEIRTTVRPGEAPSALDIRATVQRGGRTRRMDAGAAANRLAGYVTKGVELRGAVAVATYASKGSEAEEWDPELAARVIAAQYGRRRVSTSRAFYVRAASSRCRCCRETFHVERRPEGRTPLDPPSPWVAALARQASQDRWRALQRSLDGWRARKVLLLRLSAG